ncbi:hypothetical protein KIN20_017140 [Parelaphostrongylus tenuis]|uniref:Uncharacterized protein n=1 Tax=Parelaphostrongylus tenuis TaxID=148309 RepID=A0AAD5QRA1_PARTN|nr:hypothetical protein KIN20_017140 [Parelaphostrongylus tenuis]
MDAYEVVKDRYCYGLYMERAICPTGPLESRSGLAATRIARERFILSIAYVIGSLICTTVPGLIRSQTHSTTM